MLLLLPPILLRDYHHNSVVHMAFVFLFRARTITTTVCSRLCCCYAVLFLLFGTTTASLTTTAGASQNVSVSAAQQSQQTHIRSSNSEQLPDISDTLASLAASPFSSGSSSSNRNNIYSNQIAVQIEGGERHARELLRRHNLKFLGTIGSLTDMYLVESPRISKRSTEPSTIRQHASLMLEPEVKWVAQQRVHIRTKRTSTTTTTPTQSNDTLAVLRTRRREASALKTTKTRSLFPTSLNVFDAEVQTSFNDPEWPQMWYLNRGDDLDMNVRDAWLMGYTGRSIVVTILDDGLEKDHEDIVANYDPLASYDVNGHDADPQPRYDRSNTNRHGTRCAGEVAASANNSNCIVGVAFNARIGGVRMLDGEVTDAVEAASLSLNPDHIDIYSASWGPDDDGRTVDGPAALAKRAFISGVTLGRQSLGSIFVWASGNGGRDFDNCNCDGYTNAIWTLSISSATDRGNIPWYLERCSSTLATTYSSGSAMERQIITTDLHGKCTETHTGTSASAPVAAGICALALEANHGLTWRDMQHLVVRTARHAHLKSDDWAVNALGRNYSHAFGYGLMDAAAMVQLAKVWRTVPEQHRCELVSTERNVKIPNQDEGTLRLTIDADGCFGTKYHVKHLEHVQAVITLAASRRGDIEIFLTSPMGTRSQLLARRPRDNSREGFRQWPFMSVHYWGELGYGNWTLEITNTGHFGGWASLYDWSLVLYGTEEPAQPSDLVDVQLIAENRARQKQTQQQIGSVEHSPFPPASASPPPPPTTYEPNHPPQSFDDSGLSNNNNKLTASDAAAAVVIASLPTTPEQIFEVFRHQSQMFGSTAGWTPPSAPPNDAAPNKSPSPHFYSAGGVDASTNGGGIISWQPPSPLFPPLQNSSSVFMPRPTTSDTTLSLLAANDDIYNNNRNHRPINNNKSVSPASSESSFFPSPVIVKTNSHSHNWLNEFSTVNNNNNNNVVVVNGGSANRSDIAAIFGKTGAPQHDSNSVEVDRLPEKPPDLELDARRQPIISRINGPGQNIVIQYNSRPPPPTVSTAEQQQPNEHYFITDNTHAKEYQEANDRHHHQIQHIQGGSKPASSSAAVSRVANNDRRWFLVISMLILLASSSICAAVLERFIGFFGGAERQRSVAAWRRFSDQNAAVFLDDSRDRQQDVTIGRRRKTDVAWCEIKAQQRCRLYKFP